jgi:hypothetical protein
MRSVWAFSLAKSISASRQWRQISSAASFGMMPSRACERASAASKSRYFCTRFSSENTLRIASVEKMSRNTVESINDAGMGIFLPERRRLPHVASLRTQPAWTQTTHGLNKMDLPSPSP